MSTPLRTQRSSSNLSGTPSSAYNTPTGRSTRVGAGLSRVPGTPLGRVLAAEGYTVRSPRKIRQKSLPDKARDWVSNRILSFETSIQLLSFDAAGYPLAIACNSSHFLVRLPHFYSALPPFASLLSYSGSDTASRYARQAQLDADARLAALQGQGGSLSSGWIGWFLSATLVLVSVANTAYLASRRRKYQLMLRKDAPSSPNAKSAVLRFAPHAPPKKSLTNTIRDWIWRSSQQTQEPHAFPIQELYVWTPEYVLWSLRLFTGYPPPIALMYHFLSPSTVIPFLIIGPCVAFLFFSLVHLYTTLLKDRQILASETMHEYNANFVYPRVFVQKRDVGVSTEELEFSDWKTHVRDPARMTTDAEGSERKIRRGRESVAVMQGLASGAEESPVPNSERRRRRRTEMLA
ncbi:Nur1/Mug154 family protein [Sporobolomyces koalae]|uniref:Nur1/Mug154 family protein n=1 Tax=Sporobolomyces koalae TaxID=500713 RepID=UPI0031800FE6